MDVKLFVDNNNLQHNPIIKIRDFISSQNGIKTAKQYGEWRFVGGLLSLTYDSATIITHDAYKNFVGGIPRGSFLVMVPVGFENVKPHFILLRVKSVSSTPLEKQTQETYFELQKKSMPELDKWTQSELQWSALECDVLGMFYANVNNSNKLDFSGDINNIVSPHKYEVYAPNKEILDVIVNGCLTDDNQQIIGKLRTMECLFDSDKQDSMNVDVKVSMNDFMGKRTAMFGKTRLGKSNVVKLLADKFIKATEKSKNVGQLIFDINGEYANDNSQDGQSLFTKNADRCEVYALNSKRCEKAKTLKLNFYENPQSCHAIIKNKLQELGKTSNYITAFTNIDMPSLNDYKKLSENNHHDKKHYMIKFRIFWCILHDAGFECNEKEMIEKLKEFGIEYPFCEKFNKEVLETVGVEQAKSLDSMTQLYIKIAEYEQSHDRLQNKEGAYYFDNDEEDMLKFLKPKSGSGPSQIKQFKNLHSTHADNFEKEIIDYLEDGKTVILDLGNADDATRQFFSDRLSAVIFAHQEDKFVNNELDNKYVQLYFEEAHNLFPKNNDMRGPYLRFAKEGAKFHIGMIYSTQSPSTISSELLVQTENFFVGHLASSDETKSLVKNQIAFQGIEQDILKARTPGFMRMMTCSHRFVIPVQTKEYGKED